MPVWSRLSAYQFVKLYVKEEKPSDVYRPPAKDLDTMVGIST